MLSGKRAYDGASMQIERRDIGFESGGERIAGWFYPGAGPEPRPCVVIGHGFAGVKEARLDAFAERFASAGLACLVFDYRHFGGSGGEPRQLVDVRRQRQDWAATIAEAKRTPGVDPARIALWGTSFGGGHVLELAARRGDIAAAVLHMALVDPLATTGDEGLWHTLRLIAAGLRDALQGLLRRPPHLIPAVGPPGTLAFMSVPEAQPGYFAIVTGAPAWRNEVAARVVLHMATFRPHRAARRTRCPLLFVVGERDAITPAEVTRRVAARAPRAEVFALPGGHFDAYLGESFEQAVEAETRFLARHLGLDREVSGGG